MKELEKFRDILMECTNDVCGMRRVGGQRRKGKKVFYGQEPPSGESTTTKCGVNYQLLAVMY